MVRLIEGVVHGIPDVLYADHGSDFTSDHISQVTVDLHIELVHSTVGRPQGRGKLERFFGSLTTELLPELAGHLVRGQPASPPRLTLAELNAALAHWLTATYPPTAPTARPGWHPSKPGWPMAGCLVFLTASKNWTCCSSWCQASRRAP